MKANELKLERKGFVSFAFQKKGQHYKFLVDWGRCFPTCKSQARYFIKSEAYLEPLKADEVEFVENFLNKHGFEGEYTLTRSKRHAWLMNNEDLYKALKLEYGA